MNSESLRRRVVRVQEMLRDIAIDRSSIPQHRLDLASRQRTSAFPWRGQFSPDLVNTLLERYATGSGWVVDPFVGSGTLLQECARRSLNAFGVEINPAALEFARFTELCSASPIERRNVLIGVARELATHFLAGDGDLFSSAGSHLELHQLAGEILLASQGDAKTSNALAVTFMLAMGDKIIESREQVAAAFAKVRSVANALPYTAKRVVAVHGDARKLPLETGAASTVLTSPPYVNVFNYHQNYRKAVELMGWRPLVVAPSEIGANRKHRSNRFLTVIQYAIDMAAALSEMRRVLMKNGVAILVVGRESTVRGISFRNGELLAQLAVGACGFSIRTWHERSFVNRFGQQIFEDIIVLAPVRISEGNVEDFARTVAVEAIERQRTVAKGDVASDIHSAIVCADKVKPSPMFSPREAVKPSFHSGEDSVRMDGHRTRPLHSA